MDVDGPGDGGDEGGIDDHGSKLDQLTGFVDRFVGLDEAGVGLGIVADGGDVPEVDASLPGPATHDQDLVVPGTPLADLEVQDARLVRGQEDRLADLVQLPGPGLRARDRDVDVDVGHDVVQGDGDMVVRVGSQARRCHHCVRRGGQGRRRRGLTIGLAGDTGAQQEQQQQD